MQTYQHLVQYYETDQMGIVHHSNYIRWMEEARTYALAKLGIGYREMEQQGVMSPVLHVECKYRTMTHFYDTVDVDVYVKRYNGVKMTIFYRIKDAVTEEVRALGESTHCFIDKEGHPVSLKRSHPEWDSILNKALEQVSGDK